MIHLFLNLNPFSGLYNFASRWLFSTNPKDIIFYLILTLISFSLLNLFNNELISECQQSVEQSVNELSKNSNEDYYSYFNNILEQYTPTSDQLFGCGAFVVGIFVCFYFQNPKIVSDSLSSLGHADFDLDSQSSGSVSEFIEKNNSNTSGYYQNSDYLDGLSTLYENSESLDGISDFIIEIDENTGNILSNADFNLVYAFNSYKWDKSLIVDANKNWDRLMEGVNSLIQNLVNYKVRNPDLNNRFVQFLSDDNVMQIIKSCPDLSIIIQNDPSLWSRYTMIIAKQGPECQIGTKSVDWVFQISDILIENFSYLPNINADFLEINFDFNSANEVLAALTLAIV